MMKRGPDSLSNHYDEAAVGKKLAQVAQKPWMYGALFPGKET